MFNFIKILFTLGVIAALTLIVGALYLNSKLPNVDELTEAKLQVPLSVYTADGKLISQFGEYRRNPVKMNEVPQNLINAVLAIEDHRFYQHTGVDLIGLMRAAHNMFIAGGGKTQGGSTITMQVARNYYLSPEKTFTRKFNEILLALKIEREFTKEQILELYLNKIFLGNRAYGVVAAAQVYYGKTLNELTLPEMAMIAGLPQAPSRLNPLSNPSGAKLRRNHVLDKMYEYGFISEEEYETAVNTPMSESYHGPRVEVEAPYVAEMVRQLLFDNYGEEIYIDGLKAYTTINSEQQIAANIALENGLLAYDRRHGYRGPIQADGSVEKLHDTPTTGPLIPALVTKIGNDTATVMLKDEQTITLPWSTISWARKDLGQGKLAAHPKKVSDVLKKNDIIYVLKNTQDNTYRLAQIPQVQGALVAMDPNNGAITALVGGFNFYANHFNAATQAKRQPGSSFKPFIYSAALENGYTAASIINDAPIVLMDHQKLWRPKNDNEKFYGPMTLRMGLARSRNLISIRILDAIGITNAIDYASRFGFEPKSMPKGLSLALGTLEATPLEMASAYSVFANGGYKVTPHVFAYLTDEKDVILLRNQITVVCQNPCDETQLAEENATPAPHVISTENAYITTDILKDVIKRGTGRGALVLERDDIAGKTGSTNDHRDAWFLGFNHNLVASVWFGYDRSRDLGEGEYASKTALPVWIDFMREALKGTPPANLMQPSGVAYVRVNTKGGAASNSAEASFELFTANTTPNEANKTVDDKWTQPANLF